MKLMLRFRVRKPCGYAAVVFATLAGCGDPDVGTISADRKAPAGEARDVNNAARSQSKQSSRRPKLNDLSPRPKE